jgi:hypothetical protein
MSDTFLAPVVAAMVYRAVAQGAAGKRFSFQNVKE